MDDLACGRRKGGLQGREGGRKEGKERDWMGWDGWVSQRMALTAFMCEIRGIPTQMEV